MTLTHGFDHAGSTSFSQLRSPAARLVRVLVLVVLAVGLLLAQSKGIAVDRLIKALQTKVLAQEKIADLIRQYGASFRLTPELEAALRAVGATDVVINAIKESQACPDSKGPVSLEELTCRVGAGETAEDLSGMVKTRSIAFQLSSASIAAIRQAGAGDDLVKSVSAQWLSFNPLDGSLDQILFLLKCGVEANLLLPKLRVVDIAIPVDQPVVDRLAEAGAGERLIRLFAVRSLENGHFDKSLSSVLFLLQLGVPEQELATVVSKAGVDFPLSRDVVSMLREANCGKELKSTIARAALAASSGGLTLDEIFLANEAGVTDDDLMGLVRREHLGFGYAFKKHEAAALANSRISDDLLEQIVSYALENPPGKAKPWVPVPVKKATDYDPNSTEGRLDLRLEVDGTVLVYVVGSRVFRETLLAKPARNLGTEYTQPLPRRGELEFSFAKKKGRGRCLVREKPAAENGNRILIRIMDKASGSAQYHLQLKWRQKPVSEKRTESDSDE